MNEHARASELLIWIVNGRINSIDSQWLNAHLDGCAACRGELAIQRRIRDAITREPIVEFAPQASFNRLWAQIEADSHEAGPGALTAKAIPAGVAGRSGPAGRVSSRRWMRPVLVAQAAAILLLCAVLWQRPAAPNYRTVTDAAPATQPNGPVIKAIFDERVRLADVKEILAGAGLVVATGPSEAGVYTLKALDSRHPSIAAATLARLRADPRIRFAEVGGQ